jgi:hypothetical protein
VSESAPSIIVSFTRRRLEDELRERLESGFGRWMVEMLIVESVRQICGDNNQTSSDKARPRDIKPNDRVGALMQSEAQVKLSVVS